MAYSDDTEAFKKELLDAMYQALLDIMQSGGVVSISKGDFNAKYRSPAEIKAAIKDIEGGIVFDTIGCERRICSL